MKHLLKLQDLTKDEIIDILNLADQLKFEQKNGIEHHHLKGKTQFMILQKSSTRTRVSFETGMYQLGGQALFLSSRDLQIGRGEPVEDTARVLSRYIDGIMIRTFAQKEVEDLAEYGSIPIINGLTDYCHPCQVLADLMTIREYKKSFENVLTPAPRDMSPPQALLNEQMKTANSPFPIILKNVLKTPIFFTRMFGRRWVRRRKRLSVKQFSKAFRLMIMLWLLQTKAQWFSTVCLLTARKR